MCQLSVSAPYEYIYERISCDTRIKVNKNSKHIGHFLVNNAISNSKKERFCTFLTVLNMVWIHPEPDPKPNWIRNRSWIQKLNRNESLQFHNTAAK
jgi:hypothetical protein